MASEPKQRRERRAKSSPTSATKSSLGRSSPSSPSTRAWSCSARPTHGTRELHRESARIPPHPIEPLGFGDVAVEADWPDAYRVNRRVRGIGQDRKTIEALADSQRFPTWTWRNAEILELVGSLREHDDAVARPELRVGFHGLDPYSLNRSTYDGDVAAASDWDAAVALEETWPTGM